MQAKNLKRALILGAAFVGISAGAAFAEPAVSTGNINVRATPHIGNNVVGRLYRGERVFISDRVGPWCQIDTRNDEGWVSCSYLSRFAPRPPPRPYYNGGYYAGPSISFGFGFPGGPRRGDDHHDGRGEHNDGPGRGDHR